MWCLGFGAYFGSIITQFLNRTYLTERFSCDTDFSTMPDEKIRKMGPLLLWNDLHEVELNLHRVIVLCQPDPLAHPLDMGVNHNTGNTEGIPQDDIGRLPADSAGRHQFRQWL